MFASLWLRQLQRRWFPRRVVCRVPAPRVRLGLERLEDRTLLSGGLPYPTATNYSQLAADINAANQNGGANTITLGATIQLNSVDNNSDSAYGGGNGLPVIAANDQLTIVGNGYTIERSAASGTPAFRLFDVAAGATLTLQNLTLTGGLASGLDDISTVPFTYTPGMGGAIYSNGDLTLTDVTVENNMVTGHDVSCIDGTGGNAYGGGLYIAGGTVNLTDDTTLSGNIAQGGDAFPFTFKAEVVPGGDALGGVMYVAGGATATLSSATLSDNIAQAGAGTHGSQNATNGGVGGNADGGGLYLAGRPATLTNDTLSGNQAHGGNGGNGTSGANGGGGGAAFGGGLFVGGGIVTLTNDTLSANQAQGGGGGNGSVSVGSAGGGGNGSGGGLDVVPGATVTLTNDTLSGNQAQGGNGGHGGQGGFGAGDQGGAGPTGQAGNGGSGVGGGLFVAAATVTLTNDTLSANQAQGGTDGSVGPQGDGGNASGGRLYVGAGATTLTNTLIAQDTVTAGVGVIAGSATDPDVSGNVTSSDHDLVGDGSGSNLSNGVNGDQVGTSASPINPKLGPLQNNGGPTQTMALLPGSPAIDAGDSTAPGLPTTDQRGDPRIWGAAVDIGAYEVPLLSPDTLPGGTYGTAYSQTIVAAPSGEFGFAVTAGTLPPGLSLLLGGVLIGTPTAAGSFSFTLTATDLAGFTASQAYTLVINQATLTITPAAGQSMLYGAAVVPTLSYTASGFVNGDPASLLTGLLGTTATSASPVGIYDFTTGSLSAGLNYTVVLAANPPTFAVTLPLISDSSFESPALPAGSYQYDPNSSGTAWNFYGNSGIESNGSAFSAANAPDGTQAAFLQSAGGGVAAGQISQTVTLNPGTYYISFWAAQRPGYAVDPIQVQVDGQNVGSPITPTSTSWATYVTVSFTITSAGPHTISFVDTAEDNSDSVSFLDEVSISQI
jgi:hypothetical protein